MMQIADQTHEEKMTMYMKLSKKELASMLIECNRIISSFPTQYFAVNNNETFRVGIAADNTITVKCNCSKGNGSAPVLCDGNCQY